MFNLIGNKQNSVSFQLKHKNSDAIKIFSYDMVVLGKHETFQIVSGKQATKNSSFQIVSGKQETINSSFQIVSDKRETINQSFQISSG